jgi:hypothetical protein
MADKGECKPSVTCDIVRPVPRGQAGAVAGFDDMG